MSGGPRDRIAQHEADGGTDNADQQTLEHENATNLSFLGTHRDEYGDVAGLLHDHHDQRDQDIERGNEHDQAYGDEGDYPLQPQGAKKGAVLLHPVSGHEAFAGGGFKLASNVGCFVDVGDFKLEHGHDVAQIEEALGV